MDKVTITISKKMRNKLADWKYKLDMKDYDEIFRIVFDDMISISDVKIYKGKHYGDKK